jgi:uncharacterized protein YndB with AHSA1/START domain
MNREGSPERPPRGPGKEAQVGISGDGIIGTIEIAALPERVFRALTTPEELCRWWGSAETYRVTEWHADVRAGGAWRCTGSSARGGSFTVHGKYLEVDPPRRLAYTWNASWTSAPETTVVYELTALDGGARTLVQVRHFGFGTATSARDDHRSGWPSVLNWLRAWSEAHPSP